MIVGLVGRDTELHVRGIPHIHDSKGEHDLVVVAINLPPVSQHYDHGERTGETEDMKEVFHSSPYILGEVLACVEYER